MRLAPLFLALILVAAPQLTSTAPAACAAGLRLNEIMAGPASDWDGSGAFSSRDDEWVELINAGGMVEDLSTYVITDGDSLPRFVGLGTLAPGAHLVVFGKNAFDWEKATSRSSVGLSLNNTGDSVMLWQVAGAETLLVDSYTYKSHEAAADRAIGRSPDATGGWVLLDAMDPYTGTLTPSGTGCAPSPNQPNVCNVTPTKHTTWGEVKAMYR